MDGVLSRNPDPPTMHAGMPRGAPLGYSSMEEYYAAQRQSRQRSKYVLNPVTGNIIQNTSRNRQSIANQINRAIKMRRRI